MTRYHPAQIVARHRGPPRLQGEAALACAEGDCDEADLEEMYVACNASGKADGFTEGVASDGERIEG